MLYKILYTVTVKSKQKGIEGLRQIIVADHHSGWAGETTQLNNSLTLKGREKTKTEDKKNICIFVIINLFSL